MNLLRFLHTFVILQSDTSEHTNFSNIIYKQITLTQNIPYECAQRKKFEDSLLKTLSGEKEDKKIESYGMRYGGNGLFLPLTNK